MRLLECKIENFGKISHKNFIFAEGCTSFCKENGWGKSTLAAFLKVMFFGFENERGRDSYDNERKRFAPWQGEVYGGEVTFEAGGKTYILNRVFGKKEKDDTFLLRDGKTNLPSEDFSSHIGEELFLIDRASFVRTVFLAQMDCGTETTDGINAKIGNLEELTDDMKNYEKADKALKERLDKMTPKRKTGSLYKKKEEISQIEVSLKEGEKIEKSIKQLQEEREKLAEEERQLADEQKQIQKQQREISVKKDIQAKQEKYHLLCQAYEERSARKEEEKSYFPKKEEIPQEEEILSYMEQARVCQQREKEMEHYQLSPEEERAFWHWNPVFEGKEYSSEEWKNAAEEMKQLPDLRYATAGSRITKEEKEELLQYEKEFAQGVPEEKVLEGLQKKWKTYQENKNAWQAKEIVLKTQQEMKNPKEEVKERKKISPILAAGIFLLLLGVAGFLVSPWIGILGVALGIFLMILGMAGSGKGEETDREKEESPYQKMERELEEEKEKQREIENQFRDFFTEYGIEYEEVFVENRLIQLREDSKNYQKLKKKQQEYEEKNLEEKYEKSKEKIQKFFQKYFPEREIEEGEFLEVFHQMETGFKTCQSCIQKINTAKEMKIQIEKIQEEIQEFLSRHGFTREEKTYEQLSCMKDHLLSWKTACKEWEKAAEEKEKMEQEEGSKDWIKEGEESFRAEGSLSLEELAEKAQELSEKREELSHHIQDYDRQLEEGKEAYDNKMEEEERLWLLKEEYEEEKRTYHRIEKTKEYLEKAKNSFIQKYMEPVMSGFEKYYAMLTGKDAEEYQMDASARLTVKEGGLPREIRFLSSGFKDLAGICMRMALVDAMYQEEKPFLILDDPFLNLDEEKTKRGMAFLEEAAKEYQILYFTCHESRNL